MSNPDEASIARDLVQFLIRSDGYSRTTEIEKYVQSRIRDMAGDMATAIVAENREVRAALDGMIRGAIRTALADNQLLHDIVASKVAAAILRTPGDDGD